MLPCVLLLAQTASTQPLAEAQILEKFQAVPTFVVGTTEGKPISLKRGGKPLIPAFFDLADSQTFLKSISRQKGMEQSKVLAFSAAEILSTPAAPFVWIAPERQSRAVLEALKPSDPKLTALDGVPLLYVTDSKGGYVTWVQGSRTVIPFFLDLQEAKEFLATTQRERPALGTLILKGTYLERMLNLLRTAPSSQTRDVTIVPSRAAIDAFRQLRAN